MALFDLNSRYTKSMEHGGSYEREASIGGYNRKELRGLNRQARRGTLTQRERARLKYLTDERGGRRKRGLLSGLGGAAATLGALAAAGKLGEGKGGAALMDAIKLRLAEGKDKAKDKLELLNDKRLAKKLGVDPREYVDDSPASAVTEDVSSDMQLPPELRETLGADLISDAQGGGEMTRRVDEMEGDGRGGEEGRMQRQITNERNDQYVTDRDANLADRLNRIEAEENAVSAANEGGDPLRQPISNTGDRVVDEAAIERERQANMQELPGGPVARRGTSPLIPSPDGSQPLADEAISDIIRQMRSDADEEEDPEGMIPNPRPGETQRMLSQLNETRRMRGLEPVDRLSEAAFSEVEEAIKRAQNPRPSGVNPNRSGASVNRGSRIIDQIFNRYR